MIICYIYISFSLYLMLFKPSECYKKFTDSKNCNCRFTHVYNCKNILYFRPVFTLLLEPTLKLNENWVNKRSKCNKFGTIQVFTTFSLNTVVLKLQTSSFITCAAATYSDSAEDNANGLCLYEHQLTMPENRKQQTHPS